MMTLAEKQTFKFIVDKFIKITTTITFYSLKEAACVLCENVQRQQFLRWPLEFP